MQKITHIGKKYQQSDVLSVSLRSAQYLIILATMNVIENRKSA